MELTKTQSTYLNILRFCAALLVLFFHASYKRFDGGWLEPVSYFGHDAVITFFVLSGFIISYVSHIKEHTFENFMLHRMARLWSVVVPALVLTVILDQIGLIINPYMYEGPHYVEGTPIIRFLSNLFFVNEIWFLSYRPFSNGPFWSLSYEFLYYVIFASYFYFQGNKRLVCVLFSCFIAGPKILLLLPVWLMGNVVYKIYNKVNLSFFITFLLFFLPILFYFLYRYIGVDVLINKEGLEFFGKEFYYDYIRWSRRFVSDYIVGFLFSIHLLGGLLLSKHIDLNEQIHRGVTAVSSMTFILYLIHYPLLQFYGSIIYHGQGIVTLTLLTVILLAPYTEGKKMWWYLKLTNIYGRCKQLVGVKG
jgi:peptidoglycan/LPS O-acetylase OafA/YrhL